MKSYFVTLKAAGCLLCIFLILTGCSSSTDKHIPRVHHVQLKNMKFEPAQITVAKGDTIVWTNLDIITHDVTEEETRAWTSAPITMGKTWKMAVDKSASYYCSIHIVMKGKIIVN